MAQTNSSENLLRLISLESTATESTRYSQVFDRAQFVLHAILVSDVSDIAKIFLAQRSDILPLPANLARSRRGQTTKNPRQTGLSAAIRSTKFDQSARFRREGQILEQPAISASTTQVESFQHRLCASIEVYADLQRRYVKRTDLHDSRDAASLSS